MLTITYTKEAQKTLRKMPRNTARTIVRKLEQYAVAPASQAANVKQLQGEDAYRLQVGDWRVIFHQDGDAMTILVLRVKPRGGAYK
ncbi:MAG: type II toxin-antitoxin system RelE/ParE family toxin [Ectothiorhodospiraceae bacterium]|nr:type II toxin-antitoxin system RelE/ParE family toxin [Ectothiorhodospiraceae bacterium]MCH8502909.1 type II toxin-antitoxin system RelE/ParE family toxin [Ectothiorhodospiraceae bacterium]